MRVPIKRRGAAEGGSEIPCPEIHIGRCLVLAVALLLAGLPAQGEPVPQRSRVKDVATIEGIRDNQLVGYGLVVGLRGTGDSSQTVFPAQTLISALERMGITVPQTGSNSASTCR